MLASQPVRHRPRGTSSGTERCAHRMQYYVQPDCVKFYTRTWERPIMLRFTLMWDLARSRDLPLSDDEQVA